MSALDRAKKDCEMLPIRSVGAPASIKVTTTM